MPSRAGYGQKGYCKVCDSDLSREINKRMKRGDTIASIRAYTIEKEQPISEPTLRSHREHITDPKTTFVESARKNPVIKKASTRDFLQSLVDVGAAKIEADPDSVSIDQSIRAAQIIENTKEKQVDALLQLARMLMGRPPQPEYIEGEYVEVEVVGTETPKELPSGT